MREDLLESLLPQLTCMIGTDLPCTTGSAGSGHYCPQPQTHALQGLWLVTQVEYLLTQQSGSDSEASS